MSNEEALARLHALGLHVWEAYHFFRTLDTDNSYMVDVHEFVKGCLQLKENASKLDFEEIKAQIKRAHASSEKFRSIVKMQLEELRVLMLKSRTLPQQPSGTSSRRG